MGVYTYVRRLVHTKEKNTMSVYKRFSEQLHRENDHAACQAVMNHINNQGLYAARNDDKYGPDVIIYSGFKPSYFIECEIKRVWKSHQDTLPWSTVHIPERKRKFINAGLPIEFWILREDLKFAVIVSESLIVDENLVEVPNVYNSSGEYFFTVNVSDCNLVEINQG